MAKQRTVGRTAAWLLAAFCCAPVAYADPGESQRLTRAKDLIAEEQWTKAIVELQAAIGDPKEASKAEALFWLAHSQNQARDLSAAVETIGRIEREYPRSPWVRPARSLRIEIAQRMQRRDVLWWTAAPQPPALPSPVAEPAETRRAAPAAGSARVLRPAPTPPTAAPAPPAPPAPPEPPAVWVPKGFIPDTDLRIQALGSLLRVDAPKAIPMLKDIALKSDDVREARRALFVLAQSGVPEARTTVVEVARTGNEPARIAAVRELGRWGGPAISRELLRVYSDASMPVKVEIVSSLGDLEDSEALMRIAQSEVDRSLRDMAIVTLGEAGGREQLQRLYSRASVRTKRAIISGLFNARGDAALIMIADEERNRALREEALRRLRLLDTAAARQYLAKLKQK